MERARGPPHAWSPPPFTQGGDPLAFGRDEVPRRPQVQRGSSAEVSGRRTSRNEASSWSRSGPSSGSLPRAAARRSPSRGSVVASSELAIASSDSGCGSRSARRTSTSRSGSSSADGCRTGRREMRLGEDRSCAVRGWSRDAGVTPGHRSSGWWAPNGSRAAPGTVRPDHACSRRAARVTSTKSA